MPAVAPIVLALHGLRKDRWSAQAKNYSLSVPELTVRLGEKLLITGPSGSGKSTFLDMLALALKPDAAGEFLFSPGVRSGRGGICDIAAAWQKGALERLALWRRHIGYVLQTGGLLPFLSAGDNIRVPGRLLGLPEKRSKMAQIAQRLKIADLLGKFPARLSVGERQRVAIARALYADPPLILADEPLASLDPENARTVLSMFLDSVAEAGTTLVIVSHSTDLLDGLDFRRLWIGMEAQVQGTAAVLEEYP
ncbi:MAG: ATP-binding cassette domain-containing protein [Desulfovibrio sp.]|jgi:putative ABC transport system ATP-binding protein|nr:ATP-binding cassette domain-containing protein [Desulfovibrio sp.]